MAGTAEDLGGEEGRTPAPTLTHLGALASALEARPERCGVVPSAIFALRVSRVQNGIDRIEVTAKVASG
jgi:hypothetical protein